MQSHKLRRVCLRREADMTLTAQYVESCAVEHDTDLLNRSIYVSSIIEKYKSCAFGAVLELLFLYGFRISEILALSGLNVKSDGTIKVYLLKGTGYRIVIPVVCLDFWLEFKNINQQLSSVYSRFYFYREFKKLGIHAQFGGNSSYSTTHYLRHLRVLNLQASGYSSVEIQNYLVHKSIKSLKYYEQNPK
jgi:site-specific recombinase XerD